jgi:hypothetical protein
LRGLIEEMIRGELDEVLSRLKRAWRHGSLTLRMQIRGACATRSSGAAGSANRNRNTPDNRNNNLGFRVGRTLSAKAGVITVASGAQAGRQPASRQWASKQPSLLSNARANR